MTRIIFVEQYRSLSSSLCSFLRSSVTSFLLGPNILLNTLFSDTLSLCFSLNVRHQVSHPYNRQNCNFVYLKLTEKEAANQKYGLMNAVLWVKDTNIVVVYPISKSR
jgi:hypothetical protein